MQVMTPRKTTTLIRLAPLIAIALAAVVGVVFLRDIFSFEWQNHFWVPMFQFHNQDLSVKQEVRRVVHELTDVLDNWTLAEWFTEPNAWLKGGRPVDMVDGNFSYVLGAARADRFVATA